MKKFFSITTNFKWLFAAILLVGIVMINACNKDDDPDPADDPVASFQYNINADNFLEVVFTNFSQNAVSYAWDFGDGNTSTEESPTHAYTETGTYTVELTATGAEGTSPATRSETITISDPNSQLALLAGTTSKKWYLNREDIALGIGPGLNDNAWWSFGGVTPLGDRPCILDDYYEFHRDGTLTINTGGTVFVDSKGNGGWLDAEACVDESESDKLVGENGEDLSVYATGGDFGFTYEPATNLLTITGEGSYIGLPNKTNAGDSYIPIASKEYEVFNLVENDIADTLSIGMIINGDPVGGGVWNFYLVSYHDENDLPDIPTSLPSASFNYTKEGNVVTFNNTSTNATSYMWDFGDGATSTENSPMHTYAADGDYTVTLSASDNNGNSDEDAQVITISSSVFSAATLSSADGKVWTLIGEGCILVGPSEGSADWWSLGAADAEARPCFLDDEFTFFDDGSFVIDCKGQIWAEGYMGVDPGTCMDEADVPAPYDALVSGNHTFEATDSNIKVNGNGAYLGFSKPYNGGEYNGGDTEVADEVTYNVFDYATDAEKETIWVTIDISADQNGTSWWTIVLESYK